MAGIFMLKYFFHTFGSGTVLGPQTLSYGDQESEKEEFATEFVLSARKQSSGTITHRPFVTVKMAAAAIALQWSKRDPNPPFNFFDGDSRLRPLFCQCVNHPLQPPFNSIFNLYFHKKIEFHGSRLTHLLGCLWGNVKKCWVWRFAFFFITDMQMRY